MCWMVIKMLPVLGLSCGNGGDLSRANYDGRLCWWG